MGVLTALRIKTLERIRLFLLQKLQQLKRPLANYQLPQNSLLKHKLDRDELIIWLHNILINVDICIETSIIFLLHKNQKLLMKLGKSIYKQCQSYTFLTLRYQQVYLITL